MTVRVKWFFYQISKRPSVRLRDRWDKGFGASPLEKWKPYSAVEELVYPDDVSNRFGPKILSRSCIELTDLIFIFLVGHRGTFKKLLGQRRDSKRAKIRVRARPIIFEIACLPPTKHTTNPSYILGSHKSVSVLEGDTYSGTYSWKLMGRWFWIHSTVARTSSRKTMIRVTLMLLCGLRMLSGWIFDFPAPGRWTVIQYLFSQPKHTGHVPDVYFNTVEAQTVGKPRLPSLISAFFIANTIALEACITVLDETQSYSCYELETSGKMCPKSFVKVSQKFFTTILSSHRALRSAVQREMTTSDIVQRSDGVPVPLGSVFWTKKTFGTRPNCFSSNMSAAGVVHGVWAPQCIRSTSHCLSDSVFCKFECWFAEFWSLHINFWDKVPTVFRV